MRTRTLILMTILALPGGCAWGGPRAEQVRSDLSGWYQRHYPDRAAPEVHPKTGRVLSEHDALVPVRTTFTDSEGAPSREFELWYKSADGGRTWQPFLDFAFISVEDATPPPAAAPAPVAEAR